MKKMSAKQKAFNNRKSQRRLLLKSKRKEHNKQLRLAQERMERYLRRTRGREETLVL